jgi:transposase
MGPAYLKSVTTKAPNAIVCIDPFHVVKLATDALDTVRRQVWNQLRAVFAGDLANSQAAELLDRWCGKASRSRLEPFVTLTGTIRKHRQGILAALRLGVNNPRVEALNNKVRPITRRAYGFHPAQAALALVMLACGPLTLRLPYEQPHVHPHSA